MNGRLIRIAPYGRLGNHMLQYMLADVVRRRVPGSRIAGHHMPDWGLAEPDVERDGAFQIHIRGHVVPLDEVIALANRVDHVDIVIETISGRLHYYRDDLDLFRALFPYAPPAHPIAPDELAINVRLAEILGGAHPNYMPMPLSWYARLVAATGLRPVLIGQIGHDGYSQALKRLFPSARVISDLGARETFDLLRSARHLALPISTFSWLAGWLSEQAQTIHMPVAGLYNPAARPDQDYLPIGDARYQFYETPLRHWSAAADELQDLIALDIPVRPIDHADLARRFEGVLGVAGLAAGGRAMR